jgi:predicted unusual protein kinase regulating ubiquinone biosynthesis (AarF/ABC1/UbiB family)
MKKFHLTVTLTAMTLLIEGIEQGNYSTIAEAMIGIGVTEETVEVERLSQDLQKLFGGLDALTPDELLEINENNNQINRFLLDIVAVGERHGLHFPREFALLLKQFLYFDRYVHLLAPELSIYGDERVDLLPSTIKISG